jgi:hypothetical protein
MMKNINVLLALSMFLLSACAGSVEPTLLPNSNDDNGGSVDPSATMREVEAPSIKATVPSTEQTEVIVTPEIEIPSGAESLVELAIADLAQRLGVEMAAITFISFEEVVWPDSSLGCPHPDMKYKQVPQDGSRIILDFEGTTYDYHTGGGRDPFLCEQVPPGKDTSPQLDLGDFITPSPTMDQ